MTTQDLVPSRWLNYSVYFAAKKVFIQLANMFDILSIKFLLLEQVAFS